MGMDREREMVFNAILRRQEYVEQNYDKMKAEMGEEQAAEEVSNAFHNYIIVKRPRWRMGDLRHPIG